ncbi:MAG: D-2-hydroxyacid dehydrogenase [Verrucomicrobia bacterium]|nr:D-2-hydroxyacid dehydrogenase [Verrucomicrobiota bacterium]
MIVVLDSHTLNPGDLSWDALRALGPCTLHDRTAAADIVPRLSGATVALTNKVPLRAETLAQLPDLRYIGVLATGYNVVDTAAARARGIPVTNIPAYGTTSVAQHTLALILELANGVGHHAATVRAGRWVTSPDWCYWDRPLTELDGLTLGLIGYGRIGRAVAALARAFGLKVIVHTRTPVPDAENVSLDDLLCRSDIVSLHCPLTADNQGLINAARLALMKPTAFLINTSRGPLIVEADLARALAEKRIAGAALDVLSAEPPTANNPLLAAPNCVITPHLAWATRAARQRLMTVAVANVRAFLAGTPQNVVNP